MSTAGACLIAGLVTMQVGVGQAGSQPQAKAAKSPSWERVVEKAPFSPRGTVEGVVLAGRMWLSNGFSNRKSINFAEAWSTDDGVTWQEHQSDTMFSPRHEVTPYVFLDSLWGVVATCGR